MVHHAYTDVHQSIAFDHAFVALKPDSDGPAHRSTAYNTLSCSNDHYNYLLALSLQNKVLGTYPLLC